MSRTSLSVAPHKHHTFLEKIGPRGFSLIELMIAMTLFAIVSLGVYPLMWTNILSNSKNSLRNGAETAAVRWMDTLSAQGYNGLTNVAETSDPLNTSYTYQVVVTTNTVNDRKDVRLTIRWSLGSRNYNYSVETVKVRNS